MTAPLDRVRARTRSVRVRVVAVLTLLLVAAAVVDRRPARSGPAVTTGGVFPPQLAPAASISSSWYCAGATGQPGTAAVGSLLIANAGARPLHATVSLVTAGGSSPAPPVAIPVDVPALGRAVVDETAAAGPYVAAMVDLDGGSGAVEQAVQGPLGFSVSPCWTAGSKRWYFTDGTTLPGAGLFVAVLNPYPENAIVDLSFLTEQGHEAPSEYQGIIVGPGQLVVVDAGAHLPLRQQVTAQLTARTGRVVAFETQVAGPPPPSAAPSAAPPPVVGLSLTLGVPAPATRFSWPDGVAADGVIETYRIFNPAATEAHVQLSLVLDQGSAEPFDLTIAPGESTAIVANAESRIPKGVAHTAILRSLNGVGVVAQRSVTASAPSSRSGRAVVNGSGRAARRWMFAGGSAAPTLDEWLVVYNPGPDEARLGVAALRGGGTLALGGLQDVPLAAGRRLAVRINDHAAGLNDPLVVDASSDVVVERDLYGVGQPGLSATVGIPG